MEEDKMNNIDMIIIGLIGISFFIFIAFIMPAVAEEKI